MKKLVFFASIMLATVCAQAQLKVNENGNIAIKTTETPVGDLSIGYAGNPQFNNSITANNSGLYVRRYGTSTVIFNWWRAVKGYTAAQTNSFNIGVKGAASSPTALNGGRAYGVWGQAFNTKSGYNYGVFGTLLGEDDNNGAAIYGTTYADNGENTGGRYAGYFKGDVKVTGSLYASVVTSTAASASNAIGQVALATNNATTETVSGKLSQLSAVQYNLEAPATLASQTTFATRNISDSLSAPISSDTVEVAYLSDIEIQALEKNHYGLMAAQLQQIYPDLVYENQQGDLCINYIEMIPLLVESIKELKTEIATLQRGNTGGAVVMTRAAYSDTDIEESTAITIPMLKQNNPNPFTENTVIEYTLPESIQNANIYIYDMNGKQIEQIVLTERGESSITVNGGQLSAGMYLYSLIADGKVIDTKRMILTK